MVDRWLDGGMAVSMAEVNGKWLDRNINENLTGLMVGSMHG